MEQGSDGEKSACWVDRYNVDLVPSELLLKFRKEIEGFRLGFNLTFCNAPINDFQAKLVFKPLSPEHRWKLIYEPLHQTVQLFSKKIPITKFLGLQIGCCHRFRTGFQFRAGWKWKLSACSGGSGISGIQRKTRVGLFPSIDLQLGWRAEFLLPQITRALGCDEPFFNVKDGYLQASLDKVEVIVTHNT